MSISNDNLSTWTSPGFQNEEERAENTRKVVNEAIKKHPILRDLNIKVFAKGSYANNTNVRRDSDIDIAVQLDNLITLQYPDGMTFQEMKLSPYTGIPALEFKQLLFAALVEEFGSYNIDSTGNKVYKIRGSDKILNADIIPCSRYRRYFGIDNYTEGIELIPNVSSEKRFINYPHQHHDNGVNKNLSTSKRYKSIVRILKNLRNKYWLDKNYPSFMIESLAYNATDPVYSNNNGWRDMIEALCLEAWQYLKDQEPVASSSRWTEVNNYKFLFHEDQKWTRDDAKQFIVDVYNIVK